ncbi:hypothetical protein G5S35_20005 [Paraburkholderia tropica]|uniref:YadA-like family protein n=1 Tax=Paraburkholderia tropica TaxID=92647 RepID=UPI001601722D|nr:YadA-like family protein [Paraburkholderia tropica]QNB13859.1 hypothetical protein G5S35_20005 [Paraburkholderia tropica]
MNKIYRTIWNAASGRWIAVQENARARGAKGGSGARSRSRLACGALAVAAAWGGGVRAGTVLDTDGATVIAADICTGTTIGGSGLNYLAMGCNASASDTDSIAIGTSSVANGASALALGDHTYAIANGATALGGGATASGVQSVALGGDKVDAHQDAAAKATGERAVAVGAATRAMGNNSVALGSTVTAAADNAVAIGSGAAVSGAGSVALGVKASGVGANAAAIGAGSAASGDASTAIGNLAMASGKNAFALGSSASASADNAIAMGLSAKGTVSGAIAIGQAAAAQGANSIALGYNANTGAASTADGNMAIGANAGIANKGAGIIVIGRNAKLRNDGGTPAITGDGSIVIGDGASIFGSNSTALGANTYSLYSGATLVGAGARSTVLGGGTALGQGASVTADNAVALGANSIADRSNAVSVGTATAARQIVHVAAGAVSGTSTDAINGSQLNTTNTQVTANASAITALQDLTDNAVMYDSTARDLVTLGGVGSNVKLTNVAAATLTGTSTDAVNGSQLYSTNSNVTAISNTVNKIVSGDGIKYFHTGSALADSVANGTNSTAIGPAAVASYADDIAIGDGAAASRPAITQQSGNIALGASASAQGYRSIAIGYGAQTNTGSLYVNSSDIAIGQSAFAEGYNSVALGNNANVGTAGDDGNNVAVGSNTYAKATGAVAFGGSSTAAASNATAIGAAAYAGGSGSTALGEASTASAANAIAIGNGANASVSNSLALGNGATTAAAVGTANGVIGGQTFTYAGATPTGVVSVGAAGAERQVTNVAAGRVTAASTDAVNGSQLYATNTQVTTNTGAISTLQALTADAVMYDSTAHDSVTLGGADSSTPVALHNVAAGTVSNSSNDAVNGSQLFKLASSTASGLGGGSTVNSDGSITTPTYSVGGATFHNAGEAFTNIDGRTTANTDALSTLQGQTADAVMYDSTAHDSVTLGGADSSTPVALHNVAAGAVSDASNDAVNGSQLFKLASSTASGLGGGSTVNSDGSITTPTYSVGGATFHNAGEAFTNIDGRTTANTDALSTLQGQTADAVMYDSSSHDSVTLGGTSATAPIALHNVANGAVDASSFDAINGSQLFGVSSALVNALGGGASVSADGSITTPTYRIGNTTFHNVGGALTNLDGRVTDLSDAVSSGTIGLVQQDATTHAITVGKDVPGISVDFAGTNGVRLLTGVAAGNVDASSVDAVNGSQLFAIGNATANALGGGATMNANGTMSGPNYAIGGNTYNNVGGALTDLDGRVSQNAQDISDIKGDVANAVAYDSSAHDSVTLGDGSTPVSLHNVAAGTADTDAVNLGQMNDAIASVQQAADAAVNPFVAAQGNRDTEGAIASGTHATAAGANAVASGANAVALGANTQATGANSVALGADSVADRDNAVSVGSAGNERQITNVAPGTAGTDAANMNQLNAMAAQGQGYVDQRIAGVQNQISDVRRDAFGAAAAAMAVAGLPQPTEPGRTMVAAAGSRIGGQTGMALGVSYVTRNNRWVAKASASSSSQGNTGVTLGAGYQW